MQSREIVTIHFKQGTEHIKTYCGQMHSSWRLNNFPVPYREAQGSSKKLMNFLWVRNVREYIAQMCGSMLHKCTGVCCTKVREYVAQRYGSMLHKCAGVYCTNVREYIAQIAHRAVQSQGRKIGRNGAFGRPRYKWDGRTLILYFEVFWRNGMGELRLGLSHSGCWQRVGGGGALSRAKNFGFF